MSNPLAPENKNSSPAAATCALCGLSLRRGAVESIFGEKKYAFCCTGCRQVFTILMEATDSADPQTFRQTELFKQCRENGIIPRSEAQPATREAKATPAAGAVPPPEPADGRSPESIPRDGLDLDLKITNMWCPACAWLIDTALSRSPGIIAAACNFSTDRVHVKYQPVKTSPEYIRQSIARLGYQVAAPEETREAADRSREFWRFAISAALTLNIMMMSYALDSGFFTDLSPDTVRKLAWPIFVMTSIVLGYGGLEFFKKAWAGLTRAAFGMETLIVAGALSAYFYSTVSLLTGSIHLYYDTAAMLITLVLMGKTLERQAKSHVLQSLEHFFALQPTKVRICSNPYPRGRYAAADRLAAGDIFRVTAGETVAADGRIVSGRANVDESALTGEPRPIPKKTGDSIRSGTGVLEGDLKIRAEKAAADSTLGQMTKIIAQSLLAKTPLEGKTDVILQWFVPAVVGLAAGSGLAWRLAGLSAGDAILRAVTVMVIACPCALGLAIPLARVAGVSLAGKKGILVRNFSAFEQAARIKAFVFDKTGTVTTGNWHLLKILPVAPMSADRALALAAALEMQAEHFIALEICRRARARNIRPLPAAEVTICDNGLTGEVAGQKLKIGSAAFMGPAAADFERLPGMRPAGQDGHFSRVYLSIDGRPAAVFVFGDTLREGILPAVKTLLQRGLRLVLVSGDHAATTAAVGEKIGIPDRRGDLLPADKAAVVRELQQQGLAVAMVGDGINDAAALVQADLSAAVYSAGLLGAESADITLMRSDPRQLIEFLEFSGRVNRKITTNLAFTFLYNAVGIPLAMSGLLNPLVAVTAMLLSSISVTANTLLLIRHEASHKPRLTG